MLGWKQYVYLKRNHPTQNLKKNTSLILKLQFGVNPRS